MPELNGITLHNAVACRILARYLAHSGASDIGAPGVAGEERVDIVCVDHGKRKRIKVKADSYWGTDAAKIADRALSFYRREGADYAFEAVSHHVTREPGWIFNSDADELYYYLLALGQSEYSVAQLLASSDERFFGELRVERDELHVLPMEPLRHWFEANFERYTPRPVLVGDHSAWYRLVPRATLAAAVPVTVVGPVFDKARAG